MSEANLRLASCRSHVPSISARATSWACSSMLLRETVPGEEVDRDADTDTGTAVGAVAARRFWTTGGCLCDWARGSPALMQEVGAARRHLPTCRLATCVVGQLMSAHRSAGPGVDVGPDAGMGSPAIEGSSHAVGCSATGSGR